MMADRYAPAPKPRSPLKKERPQKDSAKIADMEWAIVVFMAVMLGLYLWSHLTAGREISKKLQPLVDDLFGVAPSESDSKGKPPPKPKAD
jgi:hypothetical protein